MSIRAIQARRSRARLTLAIGGFVAAAACDLAPPTSAGTAGETSLAATMPAVRSKAEQTAALKELSRAISIAFADSNLRVLVGRSVRSTGTSREFKLEFAPMIRGGLGALIGSANEQRGTMSRDSLLRLLDGLPALEFYMPVVNHRRAWKGQEVLVAAQLTKSDTIYAFDGRGRVLAVDSRTPPNIPTFVIVRSETDFVRRGFGANASLSLMDDPDCGEYTEIICEEPGGGGGSPTGGVPTNAPTGLYMTFSDLYDAAEPWIKGAPEVEVHILGPNTTDGTTTVRPIQCAGETQSGWYNFDQNSNQWSGSVLLLTGAQLDSYGYRQGDPSGHKFAVTLYEDDLDACIIHDDPNIVKSSLLSTLTLGAAHLLLATCTIPAACIVTTAIVDIIVVYQVISDLVHGNDDYLGTAVSGLTGGYNNPSSNFTLFKKDNVLNGGIRLTYHIQGQ